MVAEQAREVRTLRGEGLSYKAIAQRLGLSEQTVKRRSGEPAKAYDRYRDATLNPEAVLAFIRSISHEEPTFSGRGGKGTVLHIAGRAPGAYASRTLRHWQEGDHPPSLWGLDRFLTNLEIHIDRYFDYCEEKELNPWVGDKPAWHP